MNKFLLCTALAVLLLSCGDDASKIIVLGQTKEFTESMSFTILDEEETGIGFTNSITETDSFNFFNFEYIYNGGGIAVGDINNDGLDDIYFSGNQVSDKLYLNKGDMKFEDITETAIGAKSSEGWHTGVSMVDVNSDGWLDIYVCRSGLPENIDLLGNLLFINNKDNTFSESSSEYGVDVKRKTTQSVFFDYDNDGDLDLYVLNHPNRDDVGKAMNDIWALVEKGSPDSDVFLQNDDGFYHDVSKAVGIGNHAYGLGVLLLM